MNLDNDDFLPLCVVCRPSLSLRRVFHMLDSKKENCKRKMEIDVK